MEQTERLRTRRWSRAEYDRLIELGILDEDEPIELIDGLMVVKEPQHTPHATAVGLVAEALRLAFGAGWFVRVQLPVALDARSEPEPDVCVVSGSPRDYLAVHPSRPALIVEVAQSSLRIARGRKAAAYARAAIEDYWIVNLIEGVLELHRDPGRLDRTRRWGYRSIQTFRAGEIVIPLAARSARVAVADLLP
jgi:Uma2 family endonuclease